MLKYADGSFVEKRSVENFFFPRINRTDTLVQRLCARLEGGNWNAAEAANGCAPDVTEMGKMLEPLRESNLGQCCAQSPTPLGCQQDLSRHTNGRSGPVRVTLKRFMVRRTRSARGAPDE
jgi:hypothetical protein